MIAAKSNNWLLVSGKWPVCVALLAIAAVAGCGASGSGVEGPTGTATVKVAFDGKPVTAGSVHLVVPGEGKGGFSDLDETGTALFNDLPTGNYTVSIVPPAPAAPDPEKPSPPQTFPNIPPSVRSETTSSLRADVKEGDNEFTFDLKDAR